MKSLLSEFRSQLCDCINNSELPIDIKYYVLKDVFNEVLAVFNNFLNTPEEKEEDLSTEEQLQQMVENGDATITPSQRTFIVPVDTKVFDESKENIKKSADLTKMSLETEKEKSNKDQTN